MSKDHAQRTAQPEPTTGSEHGSTSGNQATTDEVDRLISNPRNFSDWMTDPLGTGDDHHGRAPNVAAKDEGPNPKPKNFSEWMADPLEKGTVPQPAPNAKQTSDDPAPTTKVRPSVVADGGGVGNREPNVDVSAQGAKKETDVERLRRMQGKREIPHAPRMAAIRERVDVGEHYVGSDHSITIGAQLVQDGFEGGVLITPTIEPLTSHQLVVSPLGYFDEQPSRRSFLAETGPSGVPRFVEVDNLTPLRVRYRPVAAGRHEELLTVVYRWTDGRVTTHSVVLVGRAKTMTEIAEAPMKQEPVGGSIDGPTHEATNEPKASDAAATAVKTAHLIGALDLVSDAQQLGLDVARREAESYQKMPTPPPMWLELAKLAITIGTSGIANVLSRGVTSRIGEYLANGDKVANEAFKSSNVSFALIDSLKDAMKRSAGAAVSTMAANVTKTGGSESPERAARDSSVSANSTTAFWQLQSRAILDMKGKNQIVIDDLARKALKSLANNPQTATAALNAMDDAFRTAASNASAEIAQTNASTQQWVTLVAQQSHGVEVVGKSQRPVTEMVTLREDGPWTPSRQGILELEATIPWEATRYGKVEIEHLKIHHARALGISQEIGERLTNLPLRDAAVPILIVLNGGVTRITRDEAGRVRIDGFIPRFTDTPGEPKEVDAIPTIREAFDHVFSQSLKAMGVKVKTDDASGLGDPAK